MTTKKSKKTTEPPETIIEIAEQAEQATTGNMVDNARNMLAAIDLRTTELQEMSATKAEQIDDINATIDQAAQHLEEAERLYNDLAQRAVREQVKASIAKGTPQESERAEIFASVKNALENAQKALASAAQHLEEARAKQGLARAIQEEIDEHQREINDSAILRQAFEDVLKEVHLQRGREIAEQIKAEIIAARDAFEAHQEQSKALEESFLDATEKIDTLKEEYPDLCKELWESHGHALRVDDKTPGTYILEALRSYVIALLTHGPKARQWVFNHKQKLIEHLTLDASAVQELAKGTRRRKKAYDAWGREESVPDHQKLDMIEELIKDERRNRWQQRYNSW